MREYPDHRVHLIATDGWRQGGRTFIEKGRWTITVGFFDGVPFFRLWHGRQDMGTFRDLASAKGYQAGCVEGEVGRGL